MAAHATEPRFIRIKPDPQLTVRVVTPIASSVERNSSYPLGFRDGLPTVAGLVNRGPYVKDASVTADCAKLSSMEIGQSSNTSSPVTGTVPVDQLAVFVQSLGPVAAVVFVIDTVPEAEVFVTVNVQSLFPAVFPTMTTVVAV